MAELCSWDCDDRLEHPTIRFIYRPCDLALRSLKEKHQQPTLSWRHAILMDEIETGIDELGITLYLGSGEVCWYGSSLSIDACRRVVRGNNATSLQVVAGVWAGLQYISANPDLGLIEAEDIDHKQVLALAKPYLGQAIGRWGVWSSHRTDATGNTVPHC
jgi:homospermidine synthase